MKLKLAILPLCLIVLNAFGFEGTLKQTIKNYNGSGTDVAMTWSIGAHSCRVDMNIPGKDGKVSNTVLLMDPVSKTLKTYEAGAPGDKVYYQFPMSAIGGGITDITVAKTTETKQMQGHKCEKWSVTAGGMSYDMWVARDVDFDAVTYKDFFRTSIEIQALAHESVKGFVLMTESKTGANASTVDKVSAQVVPAATLSVPSDYKLFQAEEKTINLKGK